MKVILLFWVMVNNGVTDPQRIEGFKTMEDCQAAAESLTEANPKAKQTYKYALVAQCLEVPK